MTMTTVCRAAREPEPDLQVGETMFPHDPSDYDLGNIPEGLKLYRCAVYDVGGLRVDEFPYTTEDLTPQQVADKLGAAAGEVTRPPFPHTVLVWDTYVTTVAPLWLEDLEYGAAAGRWTKG